jgi:hypothetical protein
MHAEQEDELPPKHVQVARSRLGQYPRAWRPWAWGEEEISAGRMDARRRRLASYVLLAVYVPTPSHMTFAVVDKGDAARTTRRTSEKYFMAADGGRRLLHCTE